MVKKSSRGKRQRGISLPIVLIMMIAMTIIGVSVIRNVALGERVAGSLRDQQLAFQAAEEALSYCEKSIKEAGADKFYVKQDAIPISQGNASDPEHWKSAAKWGDDKYAVKLPKLAEGVTNHWAKRPSCMIEVLEILDSTTEKLDDMTLLSPPLPYRITARGYGANENTVTMLQSNLRVPAQ